MIRIVQFKDGKYGIKSGIFDSEFLDTRVMLCDNKRDPRVHWWILEEGVNDYCKFLPLEECEKAVQHHKSLKSKSDELDISHKTIKWIW